MLNDGYHCDGLTSPPQRNDSRNTCIFTVAYEGKIIGEDVVQEGVIAIPSPRLIGLCAGVTNASYVTTTEVYPDSPKSSDEQCNRAQVACISSGLDFLLGVI